MHGHLNVKFGRVLFLACFFIRAVTEKRQGYSLLFTEYIPLISSSSWLIIISLTSDVTPG
jgi:hypothetical protein